MDAVKTQYIESSHELAKFTKYSWSTLYLEECLDSRVIIITEADDFSTLAMNTGEECALERRARYTQNTHYGSNKLFDRAQLTMLKTILHILIVNSYYFAQWLHTIECLRQIQELNPKN